MAAHQPHLWARRCIPDCHYSYEGYISHQWSFSPPLDGGTSFATFVQGIPYILLWLKGYSIHPLGDRFTFYQLFSSSPTPTAFFGWNLYFWTLQPDTGIGWYLHKVIYSILYVLSDPEAKYPDRIRRHPVPTGR